MSVTFKKSTIKLFVTSLCAALLIHLPALTMDDTVIKMRKAPKGGDPSILATTVAADDDSSSSSKKGRGYLLPAAIATAAGCCVLVATAIAVPVGVVVGGHKPTPAPTFSPTGEPTPSPTELPTPSPTETPTGTPTTTPTPSPTETPTGTPTTTPTLSPTETPTTTPTLSPTATPTQNPTIPPTLSPTEAPTTIAPTEAPTPSPTEAPVFAPIQFTKRDDSLNAVSGDDISLIEKILALFGIREKPAKIKETLKQLDKICSDCAAIKSEEELDKLSLIIHIAKEIDEGRLIARNNGNMTSLLTTAWNLNVRIGAAIEKVHLVKNIGLDSWADEEFQGVLDQHIKILQELKASKDDVGSRFKETMKQLSNDCQKYLNEEALEDAFESRKYRRSVIASGVSMPNLRNNWFINHISAPNTVNCALPGSDGRSHTNQNLVIPTICLTHPGFASTQLIGP